MKGLVLYFLTLLCTFVPVQGDSQIRAHDWLVQGLVTADSALQEIAGDQKDRLFRLDSTTIWAGYGNNPYSFGDTTIVDTLQLHWRHYPYDLKLQGSLEKTVSCTMYYFSTKDSGVIEGTFNGYLNSDEMSNLIQNYDSLLTSHALESIINKHFMNSKRVDVWLDFSFWSPTAYIPKKLVFVASEESEQIGWGSHSRTVREGKRIVIDAFTGEVLYKTRKRVQQYGF